MPAQTVSTPSRPRTLSEWFRRRCRALPLVLGASILTGPWLSQVEAAGPNKWPGSSKLSAGNNRSMDRGVKPATNAKGKKTASLEDVEETPLEDNKVKLNYISATWETVLKDVCEATGSELIADRVPSGRFSRRDGAEYTRSEAVRIINHEVERNGFRVLEKGKFLVVVDLPSQRMQYAAPIIPKATNEQGKFEPIQPEVRPQRQAVQVTRRTADQEAAPAAVTPAGGPVQQPAKSPIALTAHEEPATEAATPRPVPQEPMTMVVFRARNQRASELAKRVYRTFRDRAELVEIGRDGLPALRVRQTKVGPTSPVQFSVAIDEEREELLIDARQADSDALLKLLRRIDTPSLDTEGIQLVSSTKEACLAAVQLPKEIAALRAAREDREPLALAQADPVEPMPMEQRNRRQVAQPQGPLGDILGNLKSEVTIESIPDLGVLILKGNERDVEQVMQVIRELEKLSEGTAPKVHLLHLNNVNSDALAELLTSVFEKLTKFPGKATQPRQSVSIVAVSKPNAILIVAPANDLDSIIELAEELDQPVQAETEFQIFQLQTAIATQLAEMLTEFYAERVSLGARIRVQAEPRTNTLIVQARPNDLDEVAAMIKKIDRAEGGSTSQMKVFVLKNAVASELAAIINAAIQSVMAPPSNPGANQIFGNQGGGNAGQIAEQFREVRSTVLELLAIDKDGAKKLKSGILADVRITPDPRMNALMVAAPEASMSLIAELITLLDRPTNQVAEIKVFTLANADASLMVQQLQTLFGLTQTGGANAQQRAAQGIQVAGAEDASSGLIPLKFSVDPRTNSVIAIGAAEALRVVEAIMFRLDESDVRQRQTSVFRLKNSPAQQIAQAVQQFLTNQRDLTQTDPNLFSNVEQLEREVIVVAEPVSNSLLISATPRYHKDVVELVRKLDEAPKQVVIQALLVEVELQDTDEFGIELGFQDSILFNRSLVDGTTLGPPVTTTLPNGTQTTSQSLLSQSGSPGYLFGNPATPLGNNISPGFNPSRVGAQGLGSFSLGRTNNELGFGGLVLSASSESVSFLMRALAANRQVRVLSRPEIRTLDNQLAQIQQGQEVPVVTGVTQTQTSTGPQVTRQTSGVILTVIPRISPDNQIVMELIAEKSQFNLTDGVPIFTDLETGNTITSPVKDISVARTTVSVPNGQTIVLAGMITERNDEAHRKVPILGDIPLLGAAFRYDFQQNRRTELLMFLTPRVVLDDATSEFIKEVEMGRLHFNEAHAEEIHGPLRGVPAADVAPTPTFNTMPPAPGAAPSPIPPAVPVVPSPPAPAISPAAAEFAPFDATEPLQPAGQDESFEPAVKDSMVTPAAAIRRLDEPAQGRIVPASAKQAAGVARPKVKLGRNNWSNP
ncbi:MAG TPA: secretin N-terminal domain-containing protein [Planctomycetaceae bacterium]|nr:secretin N-terminal domain-containing protein [Planctomycetaceae bacterium]